MASRLVLTYFGGALLLTLSACGPADSDPGPGGVTAGDAEALDEAAQKLDERDQRAAEAEKPAK